MTCDSEKGFPYGSPLWLALMARPCGKGQGSLFLLNEA